MSEPKKDYYNILGIEKDSDESTIKKAYYKLAQKWHPDKNPNDKVNAEIKFKEISEAYGILSDPQKRQRYDQFGLCDGESPDFSQGFPDLSEIFGAMGGMGGFPGMGGMGGFPGMGNFSFGGRVHKERQKPIQQVKIKLKTQDIFRGLEKNIDISIQDKCLNCNGSGSKTKMKTNCTVCKGTGIRVIVRQVGPGMITQQQTTCDICHGKGTIIEHKNKCETCEGHGTFETKLNKTINITKNFDYQTVMLLKNSGNYDSELDEKADINILFVISDIDNYNMEIKNSHDLYMEYKINICNAITGYSMYWDLHPDGNKYYFKFHDVIKDNDVKFIKNLGLPYNDNNKNSRGKLYIRFKYIYPESILDTDNYKIFIKNIDSKNISDKENYIKEKVYDIKEDHNKHDKHDKHENEEQGCVQS